MKKGHLPRRKTTSKVNHHLPGVYQMVCAIYSRPGMSSREIMDSIKINYDNNGNKRQPRMFRKAGNWVHREKIGNKFYYYPSLPLSVSEVKRQMRETFGWDP